MAAFCDHKASAGSALDSAQLQQETQARQQACLHHEIASAQQTSLRDCVAATAHKPGSGAVQIFTEIRERCWAKDAGELHQVCARGQDRCHLDPALALQGHQHDQCPAHLCAGVNVSCLQCKTADRARQLAIVLQGGRVQVPAEGRLGTALRASSLQLAGDRDVERFATGTSDKSATASKGAADNRKAPPACSTQALKEGVLGLAHLREHSGPGCTRQPTTSVHDKVPASQVRIQT